MEFLHGLLVSHAWIVCFHEMEEGLLDHLVVRTVETEVISFPHKLVVLRLLFHLLVTLPHCLQVALDRKLTINDRIFRTFVIINLLGIGL